MNFKNLKTGTKILTGFLSVVLIAVIIGVIGLMSLKNVGNSFHEVSDVRMPSIQYLGQMEHSIEKVQEGYYRLLDLTLTRSERENILKEIQASREDYTRYNELFAPLDQTEEEAKVYNETMEKLAEWRDINAQQVDAEHADVMDIDLMNPIAVVRDLEKFMKDHYALEVQTMNAIQMGQTFDGGDDPTQCNFGQWLPDFETDNEIINAGLRDLKDDHDTFHAAVGRIKQYIRQGNNDAALDHYTNVMMPAAENVFHYFETINSEAQAAEGQFEEMSRVLNTASLNAQKETMALFNELMDINIEVAEEDVASGDATISASNAMVIAGIIIGVIIAIFLGIFITRMVTTGINRGVEIAETIAEGDLTINVERSLTERKDEIGRLANAMQLMVNKLSDVIGSVLSGSDNIATASQQMSSTSQEMSQGSNEQASSAEEVSSSMEQMVSNIQQNTDNAQQTEKIALSAAEGIRAGNESAEISVKSMKEIADKITIINDIAFQTNILALNAAVEAARAGEHGKGFAVVAAEVRKLAERSKVAADEIDELSKSGVAISEKAGKQLADIVPEIEKTAKLVQEISAASLEQNSGADQVNNAIQQLNQVTQQNAAASEEMATSSEELSGQAEQLKELIAYFKIDEREMKSSKRRNQNNMIEQAHAPVKEIAKKKPDAQKEKSKGADIKLESYVKDDEYEKF
ncbi:MAG: methyl-accepting chemotaxis protein [Bacteroidales bacterium]